MTTFPRAAPLAAKNSWIVTSAVTDRIAQNPETFPVKFDDYRRALVPQSHLAVYNFVEAERSVIAAVIDARRHPRLIRDLIRTRR